MLRAGHSYKAIEKAVGCSAPTISYHAKKNGLSKGERPKYDWVAIQIDINNGMKVRDCIKKYGFAKATYSLAVKDGRVTPRKTPAKMTLDELLLYAKDRRTEPHERAHIRRRLLSNGHANGCSICGISEWHGKRITLEVDHINGSPRDNSLENLRLLCPNCHSTTPTWRGRNARR